MYTIPNHYPETSVTLLDLSSVTEIRDAAGSPRRHGFGEGQKRDEIRGVCPSGRKNPGCQMGPVLGGTGPTPSPPSDLRPGVTLRTSGTVWLLVSLTR